MGSFPKILITILALMTICISGLLFILYQTGYKSKRTINYFSQVIPYGFSSNQDQEVDHYMLVGKVETVSFDKEKGLAEIELNITPEKRFFPLKKKLIINPSILFVNDRISNVPSVQPQQILWQVYTLNQLKQTVSSGVILLFKSTFSLETDSTFTQLPDKLLVSSDNFALTVLKSDKTP